MCVCDKRGDTVRWWDIRTKPVLPHQLTQYCTKRYTPTSTHTVLHKKIHLHINSQYTAQKDTLPPHQPTQFCTKRYTAQINSHYTQKEKLLILLTSTHIKLHIWFASLITTDYTTNFYRLRLHTWWCHDSAQHKAHGAAFYIYFFARVQYYNV